ncbi:nwd2 [Moniliophthora roreri MCA 2997]|uniref:Nwd2 n=2 Tax=Moniliophthora roreri TaxID=221103 RepID=V2W6K6_MONRO|nr:nwd2 [Moniliophthora roreri MCA 2997]KAI3609297.1 nwd2 [Moniliophthora roreri]
MFSSTRNVTIHDGEFQNLVYGDQVNYTVQGDTSRNSDDVLRLVTAKAAANAFYNAGQRFPPPNCHPGTRTKVLDQLNRWISNESKAERAYWLYGPAGVGKSAIAQNLCEQHAGKQLAAAFFFSRNDPSRDKLDPFVATIVYQILTSESLRDLIGPFIIEAIHLDPKVFERSFEHQSRKLILEPFLRVGPGDWGTFSDLVVIDGLDECVDIREQERLLTMIQEILSSIPQCRFVFLIHSRPEPRICQGFNHRRFGSLLGRLAIGDSDDTTRDIIKFLRDRFHALRRSHVALRHTDDSWPGEDVIHQLVRRACGQFIFVVTVVKYLESDDDSPLVRLKAILRIRTEDLPGSPYPDLDLLYHQILSTCHRRWEDVCQVLRVLITPDYYKPRLHDVEPTPASFKFGDYAYTYAPGQRSPMVIMNSLDLGPGELEVRLFRLHAVIGVPRHEDVDIHILHASFTEFLLDNARSGKYHVKPLTESEYFDYLAKAGLRLASIITSKYPLYHTSGDAQSFASSLPIWDAYACKLVPRVKHYLLRNCLLFCQRVTTPSKDLLTALNQFDPYPIVTILGMGAGRSLCHFVHVICTQWHQTVSWAKSLGARSPKMFVDHLKQFLHGVWIGYASKYPGNSKFHPFLLLQDYITQYWPKLYILILPTDSKRLLPPDWTIVSLTRSRLKKIYWKNDSVIQIGGDKEGLHALITYLSQSDILKLDPLTRWNRYLLRDLVEKRWRELGLPKGKYRYNWRTGWFAPTLDLFTWQSNEASRADV